MKPFISTPLFLYLFSLLFFSQPKNLFANKDVFLLHDAEIPDFLDDGEWEDLKNAIQQSLQFYGVLPKNESFPLGDKDVSVSELAASLEYFLSFLEEEPSPEELARFVRKEFQVYRSQGAKHQGYLIPQGDSKAKVTPPPDLKRSSRLSNAGAVPRIGTKSGGGVIFTAYHEYFLSAKLSPDAEYRYPIYAKPKDLVEFRSKSGKRILRRKRGTKLVPYYTRKEIDSDKVLKRKGLEIAWAKSPLDILFLQIQGSGWIFVPGGNEKYHIRYAADNGHPYQSVGRYLIESGAIPKEKFSRERMIEYLEGLPEKKRQKMLNQNPRYIFFEIVSATHQTRGSLMVPLTARRSIATDPKIFPKGALAFIQTELPVQDSDGNWSTKPLTRFVLNQDEGGAIQGPGRVDFFMGGGEEAAKTAQRMWYPGELYFLLKR